MNNISLSAIAIAVLVASNVTTFYFYRSERAEAVSLSNTIEAGKVKVESVEQKQGSITTEVGKEHEANLVAVSNYYIERLRNAERRNGKVSGTTGKVDGTAENALPAGNQRAEVSIETPRTVDEIPDSALPLAAQCAETTLQLEDLQDWLRKVKEANE